jgi:hypothetical protein
MTPLLSAVFKPRAHRQKGRRECNRGANPWLAHQSLSAAAAAKAAYSAVPTDDIDGTMGQRTHPPRGESTRVSVAARTLRHGLIDDDLRGRYRATITSRAKQPASRRTPRSRAVSRHKPSNAAMNSRVPAGPETSSTVGPPSGSTVITKRRNRQHWRSASTMCASVATVSATGETRTRIPSSVSSWCSARRNRSAKSRFRRVSRVPR